MWRQYVANEQTSHRVNQQQDNATKLGMWAAGGVTWPGVEGVFDRSIRKILGRDNSVALYIMQEAWLEVYNARSKACWYIKDNAGDALEIGWATLASPKPSPDQLVYTLFDMHACSKGLKKREGSKRTLAAAFDLFAQNVFIKLLLGL